MSEQAPSTGRTVHYLDDGTPYLVVKDDDIEGVLSLEARVDLADGAPVNDAVPDLTDAFREQMPRLLDLHSQPSAFHTREMERAKERGRQWKVDEMARAVREYVDRELADAPPGSVVEIVVTSNTHAGAVRIGTYTFEQTGS